MYFKDFYDFVSATIKKTSTQIHISLIGNDLMAFVTPDILFHLSTAQMDRMPNV